MLCSYNFNSMNNFEKRKKSWVLDVIGERTWRAIVEMGEEMPDECLFYLS